ncbi:MAG: patatin-like phospholipase family protein [Flavobacteriales bacterium]|nr:patatin-like phospholipase family protein [Flavobacteriales bacterium]
MPTPISLSNVDYLCFEGGVGRGILYIGVVDALESILYDPGPSGIPHGSGNKPLFSILQEPIASRPFRGVSGSSAGAITAFMLAMGMNAVEIEMELLDSELILIYKDRKEVWAKVEKFFGEPDEQWYRTVAVNQDGKLSLEGSFVNQTVALTKLKKNSEGFWGWVANFFVNWEYKLFRWADGSKILERILLKGDLIRFQSEARPVTAGPGVPVGYRSSGPKPRFRDHDNAATYIHGLWFNRGIFSGKEIREFFRELIERKLKPVYYAVHNTYNGFDPFMPFKEFFNLTGVDLVITATNISTHRPMYFSVWQTPDFPVIEAVAMSMNFPFAFRPVYVDHPVRGNDKAQAEKYRGLYVDGGMLNNYPIHAFDTIKQTDHLHDGSKLLFRNKPTKGAHLAGDFVQGTAGNEKFLGFRLADLYANGDPNVDEGPPTRTEREDIYPDREDEKKGTMDRFVQDLISTFMYPGGDGQVRYPNDVERTVYIDSTGWEAWDFSHPEIDRQNIEVIKISGLPQGQKTYLREKIGPRIAIKEDLIKQAFKRTQVRVTR